MSNELKVCMPMFLSADQLTHASELAIAENRQNAPRAAEIAGIPSKFWRPGRTLRCRFLDGDPQVQAKVAAIAQEWSQFANITFDFGDHANAEIAHILCITGFLVLYRHGCAVYPGAQSDDKLRLADPSILRHRIQSCGTA